MKAYLLSELAKQDISSLYEYTRDTWGEAQAAKYLGELYASFDLLALNQTIGRVRPEIDDALRSFVSGKHVVFYMFVNDNIAIARVLHGSRDAGAAFEGKFGISNLSFSEDN